MALANCCVTETARRRALAIDARCTRTCQIGTHKPMNGNVRVDREITSMFAVRGYVELTQSRFAAPRNVCSLRIRLRVGALCVANYEARVHV